MTIDNINIRCAIEAVSFARGHLEAVIADEQRACNHLKVAECDYRSSSFTRSCDPPIRICLCCGLAEEGWGIGYKVLNNDERFVGHINRDEIYRLWLGGLITDDKKPL